MPAARGTSDSREECIKHPICIHQKADIVLRLPPSQDMPGTQAPSPSSGNIKRQGFTSWDYALCLAYLGLTFYVSFRSAFSGTSGKSAGLKSNGSGRKNEKGSDDGDDKTKATKCSENHPNAFIWHS